MTLALAFSRTELAALLLASLSVAACNVNFHNQAVAINGDENTVETDVGQEGQQPGGLPPGIPNGIPVEPAPTPVAGSDCVTTTCEALEVACGVHPDGCGGGLACGAPAEFPNGAPASPSSVLQELAAGAIGSVYERSVNFFSSCDPVQVGVPPGAIAPQLATVISGRVVDKENGVDSGLVDVEVSILGYPDFGQTLTRRADGTAAAGTYDIVVNGGARYSVRFRKPGYIDVHRDIVTSPDRAHLLDDIVMLRRGATTQVAVPPDSPTFVRGDVESDSDGERQASLMFLPETRAYLRMLDGTATELNALDISITEFTVGPDGQRAMPASLPQESGYTYAVELEAEQALVEGAEGIVFGYRAPILYVDNFLREHGSEAPLLAPGDLVPFGYYDRHRGAWAPSEDGRVIEVVGTETSAAGALALLDTDGDGGPDDVTAQGISDEERRELAAQYAPGKQLWRLEVPHFTPWDANLGAVPLSRSQLPPSPSTAGLYGGDGDIPILAGPGAQPPSPSQTPQPTPSPSQSPTPTATATPPTPSPSPEDPPPSPDPWSGGEGEPGPLAQETARPVECTAAGSVIEINSQVLGESVDLVGTPHILSYRSDRVLGFGACAEVPLALAHPDPDERPCVKRATLMVSHGPFYPDPFPRRAVDVSFQHQQADVLCLSELEAIQWDSADPEHRWPLVSVGRFRARAAGIMFPSVEATLSYTYDREYLEAQAVAAPNFGRIPEGAPLMPNTRPEITVSSRAEIPTDCWDSRLIGLGGWTLSGHHVLNPKTRTLFLGSGEERTVRKSTAYRVQLDMLTGKSNQPPAEPGRQLEESTFRDITDLQYDRAGRLHLLETHVDGVLAAETLSRIWRVEHDGTLRVVAGGGSLSPNGLVPFEAGQLSMQDVKSFAIDRDGRLLFGSRGRLMRVDPSGLGQVIGGAVTSPGGRISNGDGGRALDAAIPETVTFVGSTNDGSIYFAGEDPISNDVTLRRIGPDGMITTLVGSGARQTPFASDAASVRLYWDSAFAVDGPGRVFIATRGRSSNVSATDRLLRVGLSGQVDEIARVDMTEASLTVLPDGSLAAYGWFQGEDDYLAVRIEQDGRVLQLGTAEELTGRVFDLGGDADDEAIVRASPKGVAVRFRGAWVAGRRHADVVATLADDAGGLGETQLIPSEDGRLAYVFENNRHVRTVDGYTGQTVLEFDYTAEGYLSRATDSDGLTTRILRDVDGFPTAIEGPYGVRTTLELNGDGYLTKVTDVGGNAYEMDYRSGRSTASCRRSPTPTATRTSSGTTRPATSSPTRRLPCGETVQRQRSKRAAPAPTGS